MTLMVFCSQLMKKFLQLWLKLAGCLHDKYFLTVAPHFILALNCRVFLSFFDFWRHHDVVSILMTRWLDNYIYIADFTIHELFH